MSSRFAVEKLDHGPLLTNHSHLYNRNTNVLSVHVNARAVMFGKERRHS